MTSAGIAKVALLVCLVGWFALANAADYRFIGRRSTPGNDVPCGQKDDKGNIKPLCRVCDGVASVADACDNNPACKGFDMENSCCGYLKAAAGEGKVVYTEGFSHYCKMGAGSTCTGDYMIKRRADIMGKDIDCNAKRYDGTRLYYCEISGNAVQVAAACNANLDCQAFTMSSGYGGYLKTASGPTSYTEGTTTYTKA